MKLWLRYFLGGLLGLLTTAGSALAQQNPVLTVSITQLTVDPLAIFPSTPTIFAPPNESSGPAGTLIYVEALAVGTSPGSGITYSWTVNGSSIGTTAPNPANGSPGIVAWTPPQPGIYYISVIAADGLGNTASSLAVRYFATGTAVTSPADGTLVPVGSSVVLKADATFAGGFIKQIQFFDGATPIGTDTTYPYSVIYTVPGLSGSTHAITAKATDNAGVIHAASAAVNLTLVTAITPLPTVTITSPLNGAAIAVPGTSIPITVNANSTSGRIATVEIYIDGELFASDTTFPYGTEWTPTTVGTYNLTALAYDDKNNVVASSTNVVDISAPPTVSITSPVANGYVASGTVTNITADAADSDGTIAQVEFYHDGILIGIDTTAPYTMTWTPNIADGNPQILIAIAKDNLGLSTVSSTVSVIVTSGGGGGGGAVGTAPVTAITTPTTGSTVAVNYPTTVNATASDTDGTVTSVQFFANPGPFPTTYSAGTASQTGTTVTGIGLATFNPAMVGGMIVFSTGKVAAITAFNSATTLTVSPSQTVAATTYTLYLPYASTYGTGTASQALTTVTGVGTTFTSTMVGGKIVFSGGTMATITGFTDATHLTVTPSQAVAVTTYTIYYGTGSGTSVSIGTDAVYPYSATWTPTSTGIYALTSVATDNDGNQTTSSNVIVYVADGTPPVVAITSPLINSVVNVNADTTISATATDNGSITSVEFFVASTNVQTVDPITGVITYGPDTFVSLGTDTASPYTALWNPTKPGSYSLIAVATDNVGLSSFSTAVTVFASGIAPTVSITGPSSPVSVNTAQTITATAADADGNIVGVQFYVDGTSIGTDVTYPYTMAWTPTAAGTYQITAVATDSSGLQTTSAASAITAAAGSTPSVTITSPVNASTVPVNNTTTITANASDGDGTVVNVQFLVNGTLLSTAVSYPYTAAWTPTTNGTYSLKAIATDNAGNQATNTISVTVAANVAPTVSISSPAAGTVAVGSVNTITATAGDTDGTVASVQFFVTPSGGTAVSLGTDTSSPFTGSWTPTIAGTYTLTAVATDNLGTTTTSAGVAMSASGGVIAPTVTITAPSTATLIPANVTTTVTATTTVQSGKTIAGVQFFANGVSLGTDTVFPYTAAWTPTATGVYLLTAVATDSAGIQAATTATVSITVQANAAPTVSITSPAASTVGVGVATSIAATAGDTDGTVASVQFFVTPSGGTAVSLGTDTSSPFTGSWTPTIAGNYTLTAVATDNVGATTTSTGVAMTASGGNAPSVSITAPSTGILIPANVTTTVTATATPASGLTIASVQFFANGVSLGSDTVFPYSVAWTPTATGTYLLTALTTDSAGNQAATTATVSITVQANAAPTVSITSPAASTVGVGVATALTAAAGDTDGTVASVQFFVTPSGGTAVSLGTDTTSPFTGSWTPTIAGAYTLTAVATDNVGATTTSAGVAMTASGGNAPSVSITAPSNGTTVPVNSNNTITATATPASGLTIASVQFFANGVSLGSDTVFPYSVAWTPTATGVYLLTALTADSAGNQAVSSTVTVTVSAPTPGLPSVAVVSPPTGTTFTVNQPVVLAAIATDPDGTVANVEFVVNNVVVGSKAAAPYFTIFTPTTAGAYSITAIVTDNDGNRVTSSASSVTVAAGSGVAPIASLFFNDPSQDTPTATSPVPDPFAAVDVDFGSKLILTAAGVSQAGTIVSAQFFVNGVSLVTDAASPFYTTTTLGTLGQVVITALVTDSLGNHVFTVPVFLNSLPSTTAAGGAVTLISPVNGATYVAGGSIVFDATHNFGSVTPPKIDFYLNGVQAATVSAAPYQYIVSLARAGIYDVHAVIRSGTTTTVSSMAQITVTSNTAPTVSITNPLNATSSAIGTSINIAASASDPDGTIQSVQFFANGALIDTDTVFPYGTTFTPVATGVYKLTALATDNAGNQTLSAAVSITVTAGSLPTVNITAPTNGSSVAFGSTVNFTATATSNVTGATIASVQFFANGVSLGSDTTYPYAVSFTPGATGGYALTAQAIDTAGNQATSSVVNITVSNNVAPSVNITTPANASTVGVGSTNSVTANATDTDGSVASVQFFVSYNSGAATSLGTVSTSPYTVTWTPRIAGSYALTAVATDNLAATTTSSTNTVTVTGGNAPNPVTLTAPSVVAVNSSANLTAAATAVTPGATIASVQFFANGISLGVDTVYPYTVTFTPTAKGSYSLYVLATDTAGNQAVSATSTVTVTDNSAPSVSITAPANASTVGVGSSNTVTASATDTDGSVASVQFFVSYNGSTPTALGTVTASPYTVTWTPRIAGSYSLTAIATDNLAATTTSTAIGVTVSGGNAPNPVTITAPATGTTSAVNTPVSIVATATAATGTIASVQFFANGVSLGTDTAYPYGATFTPVATGTYALTALATDTALNQTLSAAVSLTVNATGGTAPTVSITSPANAAVIVVGTTGTLAANALANAAGATIAQVQFFANGVLLGTDTSVPYTAPFSPVALGAYTLTATATDTLGNQATTSVSVTVNEPPTVSLTAPAAGASLTVGSATTVSANASDSNGTVASVQFFANGVSLGTDATSPYSVSWTPTASGSVSLTAVATDNNGTTTTSPIVVVSVTNTAPAVTLTAPANAATIAVGSATTVTATATDADGSVASVQFFVSYNGGATTSLGTDTTSPYSATLTPTATGTYVLTAVATDNLGATTTSSAVIVTAAGGTAPTVSITSPANSATIAVNSTSTVTATATANAAGATIASVQFFANGVSLGTDTVYPYTATFAPTAKGTYTLTALATDTAGNQATNSSAVTVTVSDNTAPTVSITAPANASTVGVGSANSVTATATDTDGSVASVQFFVSLAGGAPTSLGTVATSPYTVIWTPRIGGSYALTAVATDNLGATTTSATVTVTASGGNVPAVSLTAPADSATVQVNKAQSVTATAAPVTGVIASVQFFVSTGGGTPVSLGTSTVLPYATTWTPTVPGIYTLIALATDSNGNQAFSTAIAVTAAIGLPPTVTIVNPNTGGTYVASKEILFDATASDPDGTIAKVEFLANGLVVATDTGSPYFTNWAPASPGNYTLIARATDNSGNVADSTPVLITVTQNIPGVINLLSPADGAQFTAGTPVVFFATASDANGTISNVRFLANGDIIGTNVTTAPYTTLWTPTIPGTYTIMAIAVDNDQNASTSPTRTVTIKAPVGTLPTVAITSPAAGASFTTASTVPLVAGASDVGGSVASVALYDNGVLLGSVATAPYALNWTPASVGTHRLVAVATDSSGNIVSSAPVDVSATAATSLPPTVTLANPGAQVTGATVGLTATASDPDGTVASVQFFVNGVALSTDALAPFTAVWQPTQAGTYRLIALATDSSGNQTVSTAVSVAVTSGTAPSVAITAPASGANVPVNVNTTISATATAAVGTIASVQFLDNGVALATVTAYPYDFTWKPAVTGSHTLQAVATDTLGNQTTATAAVAVYSGTLPTISIINPANGASVTVYSAQTIVADVSPGTYAVEKVEFFVNGTLLATVTAYPYGAFWTPVNLGSYTLTAVVTNTVGTKVTSAPIIVTVPTSATVVSVVSNNGITAVPSGSSVILRADPSPSQGVISQVKFFDNGVVIGAPDVTAPYTLVYTPQTAVGTTHAISAQATNNNGAALAMSASVTLTVVSAVTPLPTVSIVSPLNATKIAIPDYVANADATVPITVDALTSGGYITKVELYLNGVLLPDKKNGGIDTIYPYTFDWAPFVVGSYQLVALAYDDKSNIVASVPTTVLIAAPPTVAITSPANLGTVTGGSITQVTVTASSGNGFPVNVQLFADGRYVGETSIGSAGAPGTIPYTPTQKKIYDAVGNVTIVQTPLYAIASDPLGFASRSATINLNVTDGGSSSGPTVIGERPKVDVTSPTASSRFSVNTPVTLTAAASDTDGNIVSVIFAVNGQIVQSLTAYPYTMVWTPANLGNYAITAKVTDNDGNSVSSTAVTITVVDPSPGTPVTVILSPTATTKLTAGTTTSILADAKDLDGTIASVQIYVDGQPLGALLLKSPYNTSWTPANPGTYTLMTRATDNIGNQGTSAPVTVTVAPNAAPAVALTSPKATTVVAGTTVALAATASDSDGTITAVKFLANGILIATQTSSPYTTTWTPGAAGTYTLVAQATDDSGNITNSSPVVLTVVSNQAPTVSITGPSNGSVFNVGTTATVTATASDPDGTIASVQFLANGTVVDTVTTAPFKTTWSPSTDGVYNLTAVATDNAGATTTSPTVTVLAVIFSTATSDTVYAGSYAALGESGSFAAINLHGRTATLIGYVPSTQTLSPAKTYYFSNLPIDAAGGFTQSDTAGKVLITGRFSDTGVSGTIDSGRLTFIGPATQASTTKVASGYYSGSILGHYSSILTGLVGLDGTITLYLKDGTFVDSGASTVDSTGAFTITTRAGNKFAGKADPATGFLSGTLSGAASGTFAAALPSGNTFSDGFLRNISTRGLAGPGINTLIAGFVVTGDVPKQILIRAIGPSLGSGLTGLLPDPQVQLYSGGAPVAGGYNDNWGSVPGIGTVFAQVGAFALPAGSKDAAVVKTLAPGVYSALVNDVNGASGLAMVELYDVDNQAAFSTQKMVNISTRAQVGTGNNVLIAGFVVNGSSPKKVLVRGLGPTLTSYGVTGVLADPILRIVRPSDGLVIRENDNWEAGNDPTLVVDAASRVGAIPLASGSKDAVILMTLPPGIYSALLSGASSGTGIGLVEVYEVP